MADIWTKEKRSEVMAAIRGKENRSTELRMIALMRASGIKGWRGHQPLPGKPDFIFRKEKVAVFVDGCFWHGCPRCFREPSSRPEYWGPKIAGNRKRDRRVTRQLRAKGWSVIRVWECSLKKRPEATVARLQRILGRRGEGR